MWTAFLELSILSELHQDGYLHKVLGQRMAFNSFWVASYEVAKRIAEDCALLFQFFLSCIDSRCVLCARRVSYRLLSILSELHQDSPWEFRVVALKAETFNSFWVASYTAFPSNHTIYVVFLSILSELHLSTAYTDVTDVYVSPFQFFLSCIWIDPYNPSFNFDLFIFQFFLSCILLQVKSELQTVLGAFNSFWVASSTVS